MKLLKVDLIFYNIHSQKEKYSELRCVKKFLRTSPTFHKKIRFGIKIIVSQYEVFLFYPAKILKNPIKK